MNRQYCFNKAILFSLSLLCACSRNEPPSEVLYTPRVHPYHTVQPNDTVSSVAAKYKMNEAVLISLNSIKSPYKLIPGQRLLVHAHPQTPPATTEPLPGEAVDIVVTPIAPTQTSPVTSDETIVEEHQSLQSLDLSSEPVTKTIKPTTAPSAAGYIRPVLGKVKIHPYDSKAKGVLITPEKGNSNTAVLAIADGVVKHTGSIGGYGNCVVIKHANQNISIYCHLSKILVKPEKMVAQGTNIATMGKTGGLKQPSLLLQIYNSAKKPINPAKLLP